MSEERQCAGRKRGEKHKAGDAASTGVLGGTRAHSNDQALGTISLSLTGTVQWRKLRLSEVSNSHQPTQL